MCFWGYQIYLYQQLKNTPVRVELERKKHLLLKNKKNRLYLFAFPLLVLILLFSVFTGVVSVMNQQENKRQSEALVNIQKTLASSGVQDDLVADVALSEYDPVEWDPQDFLWNKLMSDGNRLDTAELEFSEQLSPYFGETNVLFIKGVKSNTLTVSVFSRVLSQDNYIVAKKNMTLFVETLSGVKEVGMIDFSFSYQNEKGETQKKVFSYARDDKDNKLVLSTELEDAASDSSEAQSTSSTKQQTGESTKTSQSTDK